MAEFFDEINSDHRAFIEKQKVFFIATAAKDGRISLSPKGMDCFHIFDDKTIGYLDVGGSGNETQAHLGVDGRATIMFCAFEGPALILRLYGHGRAILPQDEEWAQLIVNFNLLPGSRKYLCLKLIICKLHVVGACHLWILFAHVKPF